MVDESRLSDNVTGYRTVPEDVHPPNKLFLLEQHIMGRNVTPVVFQLVLQFLRELAKLTHLISDSVKHRVKGTTGVDSFALRGMHAFNERPAGSLVTKGSTRVGSRVGSLVSLFARDVCFV